MQRDPSLYSTPPMSTTVRPAALLLLLCLCGTASLTYAQAVPGAATEEKPADPATAALWQAAMDGRLAEARRAIAEKAQVNAASPSRMTALGIAALYGHTDIIE